MSISYNGSERHKENARKAAKLTQAKKKCKFCDEFFSLGNLVGHEPKCLHAPQNRMYCKNCSEPIFVREKKFCNKSCAATYNNKFHSKESRQQQAASVSGTMKGRASPRKGKFKLEVRICASCYSEFTHRKATKRTTCSEKCKSLLLSKNAGERETVWSRRKIIPYYCKFSKSFVNLQSTWEVETAQYLDDCSINWIRPKSIIWEDSLGKAHRYYADFYLPDLDLYLDPKNPWVMKKDQEKITKVSEIVTLMVGSPAEILEKVAAMASSASR